MIRFKMFKNKQMIIDRKSFLKLRKINKLFQKCNKKIGSQVKLKKFNKNSKK